MSKEKINEEELNKVSGGTLFGITYDLDPRFPVGCHVIFTCHAFWGTGTVESKSGGLNYTVWDVYFPDIDFLYSTMSVEDFICTDI